MAVSGVQHRDRQKSRRRFPGRTVFLALLAIFVVPACFERVAAEETGRITGEVILSAKLTQRRPRLSLYPDAGRAASKEGTRSLADEYENVVVYVESSPALTPTGSRRATDKVVRQAGLTFTPHVTAVVKGDGVAFENADPLFHNVFSLSRAATFDLGRYPSGKSKRVTFDETGVVKVFCHIHPDMSAVVLVLDNPFFATPDREGRFLLEGLPPGEYRVTAWHERTTPVTRRVRVESGRDVETSFEIPLTDGEVP